MHSISFKKSHLFISIFFAAYLIVGLTIFDDYGVSWDEPQQRIYNGEYNYNYIFNNGTELLGGTEKYHGPAFEILLIIFEKAFHLTDTRSIYLMRHLVNFLLFYLSVFFFYLLCKNRFDSWGIGLIGCLFLILSPRIFGHSFYNSKDIPFLSVFIISIFTLTKYTDKKTFLTAFWHALACGFLIDIRILGILVPFYTFLFFIFDLYTEYKINNIKTRSILNFILYSILVVIFTILFWPILWEGPVYHFIHAFYEMSRFHWHSPLLYCGYYGNSNNLPWHYVPVWMIVTTPILYSILFFIGVSFTIISIAKSFHSFHYSKPIRNDVIFMFWFFLPLLCIVGLKSVLYDGWRHMFFIYPAFILLSLNGIIRPFEYVYQKFSRRVKNIFLFFFILAISISCIITMTTMIKFHPYQNIYFNKLAGKDMATAKKRFEMDYWGLSVREAIEYILKTDKSKNITVFVENDIGEISEKILPPNKRERLKFVYEQQDAKYYITIFRINKEGNLTQKNEYYSLYVGNAKVMTIYQLPIWDWLLLGNIPPYHDNRYQYDYLKEHGGETGIIPEENMEHTFAGGIKNKWFKFKSSEGGYIKLDDIFNIKNYTTAYAFTTVNSPEKQKVIFAMGSDDGIKVWLNGELIHKIMKKRAAVRDEDKVEVTLNKGKNFILIKTIQIDHCWEFYFQIINNDILLQKHN